MATQLSYQAGGTPEPFSRTIQCASFAQYFMWDGRFGGRRKWSSQRLQVCTLIYRIWSEISNADLFLDLVWERPVIDRYEASVVEKHLGFWEEVLIMMGLRKGSTEHMD